MTPDLSSEIRVQEKWQQYFLNTKELPTKNSISSETILQEFIKHPFNNPFKLLQQNTTEWVAYTQQKFLSHSSGG